MSSVFGVVSITIAVSLVIILAYIASCYKRCPSDRILVIFGAGLEKGRSVKCIHGGGAFVMPLIQDFTYLSLEPMKVSMELNNALSKDDKKINLEANFRFAISTNEPIMTNAAERLLMLSIDDVEELAKEIIKGQLKLLIARNIGEDIKRNRDNFIEDIIDNIEPELNKIGLHLINVDVDNVQIE